MLERVLSYKVTCCSRAIEVPFAHAASINTQKHGRQPEK